MTPAEIRQFPMMPGTPELLLRSALTFRRQGQWPGLMPVAKFTGLGCDADYLRDYHAVLGSDANGSETHSRDPLLTALYPLAQRAQLALMLEREFPFPIPGVVHLGNGLRRCAAIDWQAAFDLTVTVERAPEAGNGSQILELRVEFSQHGQAVAHCDSRYLVRRGNGRMRRQRPLALSETPALHSAWAIGLAEIRRYARVSGDYNPIHLHPITARMLGAPDVMAHGMYLAGRVCAELQHGHGNTVTQLDIEFLSPVLVPATAVSFEADAGTFRLRSGQRPLAQGHYQLAQTEPVAASS